MSTEQLTPPRSSVGRRTAPNLTRINAWFDLALGGLMIGTGLSAYLDTTIHIVFGATMLVAVLVHLALHRKWIAATAQRLLKIPASTRYKLLLVLLMLLVFVPLVLSGVVVALIYAPRVTAFHTRACYLFVGLLLLHLALSWRWIAARLRRG